MLTREKVEAGMNPNEARRQARIELGGVEQVKERVRQSRVGADLDPLFHDVRFTLRVAGQEQGIRRGGGPDAGRRCGSARGASRRGRRCGITVEGGAGGGRQVVRPPAPPQERPKSG